MTVLADRMSHVRSASFHFLIPAGAIYDPPECPGMATVLIDMMSRGAGQRDSRQLSEALDRLGVDRSESVGISNVHFSGVTLSRNVHRILEIYADILRCPVLPHDELEAAQSLAIQNIQGLDDDPQSKIMTELTKRHYPEPLGRDKRGTIEGIEKITAEALRDHYQKFVQPQDVILSIAGDFDWQQIRDHIGKLFEDWPGQPRLPVTLADEKLGSGHIPKDIEQTQMALAYPSVTLDDPDYYNARGAVGILSQDMSSRLFTNIREKYGLCYAIHAGYEAFKDRASIVAYSAARPELAQQTLDLLLQELRQLKNGIDREELDRVKVGLKASLIMRQESTGARSSSLTSDWYYLGRIRTLQEIQSRIDAISIDGIIEHVTRHPVENVTMVSLGPTPLIMS